MSRTTHETAGSDWYRDDRALLEGLQTLHRPISQFSGIRGYGDFHELRRGGQGVVYTATQLSTRRRVAVKVLLDAALATDETKRRFEREIDLVAQLSHSNVVRVFDRGTTDDGRHYCVMEYIDGASLDQLMAGGATPFTTIHDTLRFFSKICDAVQYAHQRGVIHRDLKPSNVCVDRAGEPHVLDFGLAKPINVTAQSITQFTHDGQFMGSLPWASPEQAKGSPSPIDVRTDVYSLGVMLYQLLTGRFPYEVAGPLPKVLENILIAEPTPPGRVRPEINEELSTLILKCLAKEPDRRYQSAGELARDVRHYLAGEPLEAKRDSAWYAVRKALGRYRTVARVSAAFLVISICATIWLALLWQRATAAERLAAERLQNVETARSAEKQAHEATTAEADKAKQITAFLDTTLRFVDPWKHPGRDITPLREMLGAATKRMEGAFEQQPEVEAAVAGTLGYDYWTLGLYEQAEPLLRRSYELFRQTRGADHFSTFEAMHNLASLLTERGRHSESEPLLRELVENERRVLGAEHEATLRAMNNLAYDIDWQGRVAEAAELYKQALDGQMRTIGPKTMETLRTMNNFAIALPTLGQPQEGERLMRDVIAGRTEVFGPLHPETLQARMNLAQIVGTDGRVAESEQMLRELLPEIEAALGPNHPLRISVMGNLAGALGTLGKLDESLQLEQQAYAAEVAFAGPDNPGTLLRKNQLVCAMIERRRYDEAVPLARELKDQLSRTVGADDMRTLVAAGNLAFVLKETGSAAAAEALWREILAIAEPKLGVTSQPVITARTNLGGYFADLGRWPEAEENYRAALNAAIELNQENSWRTAVMRSGLGRVLLETGRLADAEENLLRAYSVLYEAFGDQHERTQRTLTFVVRLFEVRGDEARAAEFRAKLAPVKPSSSASEPAAPQTSD
jgi:tetratricopeptide (TPR) repeat protein/tRNA A-37 threonylcarbamoyl transferase component Bud32